MLSTMPRKKNPNPKPRGRPRVADEGTRELRIMIRPRDAEQRARWQTLADAFDRGEVSALVRRVMEVALESDLRGKVIERLTPRDPESVAR